jgi:pyruvate carboxylase
MKIIPEGRITPRDLQGAGAKAVLEKMRRMPGYYLTNTERDLSQSDFKNRILPHTQMLVAPERNEAGYF